MSYKLNIIKNDDILNNFIESMNLSDYILINKLFRNQEITHEEIVEIKKLFKSYFNKVSLEYLEIINDMDLDGLRDILQIIIYKFYKYSYPVEETLYRGTTKLNLQNKDLNSNPVLGDVIIGNEPLSFSKNVDVAKEHGYNNRKRNEVIYIIKSVFTRGIDINVEKNKRFEEMKEKILKESSSENIKKNEMKIKFIKNLLNISKTRTSKGLIEDEVLVHPGSRFSIERIDKSDELFHVLEVRQIETYSEFVKEPKEYIKVSKLYYNKYLKYKKKYLNLRKNKKN